MGGISERLAGLGAQHDVVQWAQAYGDDWERFYEQCPRADWLLALAARFGAEPPALTRAAVACTRFAASYLHDEGAQLEAALAAAEHWAAGDGDAHTCAQHAKRLSSLPSSDDIVTDTVTQAACAALASMHEPQAASFAASCAVQAAVFAAGDCAMDAALRFSQERCAQLVRQLLPAAMLAALSRA